MVVHDLFTRRIVGFAVHQGNPDGGNVCYMFNTIAAQAAWPKYLSSDNDPLFEYWLWKVNLEDYFHIEELKTVPHVPWSHPFVERLIGSCRGKFTDRILFWNKADLEGKLKLYQEFLNDYRVHYAHSGKTPTEIAGSRKLGTASLKNFTCKPVCDGLFHTPIAA